MNTSKRIISIDPWPVNPIEQYSTIESGPWGYLTTFDDGTFEFNHDISPTRDEIVSLWHGRFNIE